MGSGLCEGRPTSDSKEGVGLLRITGLASWKAVFLTGASSAETASVSAGLGSRSCLGYHVVVSFLST